MSEIEQYVHEVLHNIHAPSTERQRIEADLRAHLEEATAAGQAPHAIIDHMGSPTEVAGAFMAQVRLNYAGFWVRLAAFLLDWMVMLVCISAIAAVLAVVDMFWPRNPQGIDWVIGAILLAVVVSATLAMIGIGILYFPIQEARFGRSLGKRVLGLYVLKENGLPIGYKEAFLRRIPTFFNVAAVDALFIPFSAKKQRAFDIVARTVVVKE